ncbi:MAG TPA: undecaprenyl-diphosphate phosphatase [Pseudonocardiaceae bacterium]|jgi:undecaprenyl-diphosphatase|nr:undecaprenyl-diphosphate phosphatase [Pseudonocardiaceae bacterium]
MSALTYPEAIFVGLLQGVSELFPVSSLGHSVLVPALIGGQWANDMNMTVTDSPYLTVLVMMHVATAVALVVFFWKDWVRIVSGLFTAIRYRSVQTPDERLAVLLVVATIPVGIAGVILDKVLREYLGKPVPAAIFLALNGVVLFTVERMQRNRADDEEFMNAFRRPPGSEDETMIIPQISATEVTTPLTAVSTEQAIDARLAKLGWGEAISIGACQIFALLPGISRSGITMVGGLMRGLKHEDAARFAFLLATPVIAAAGLFKLPEMFSPDMHGSLGPAVVGSILGGIASYFSVRFLTNYFETRTLKPFALYCIAAGVISLIVFGVGLR